MRSRQVLVIPPWPCVLGLLLLGITPTMMCPAQVIELPSEDKWEDETVLRSSHSDDLGTKNHCLLVAISTQATLTRGSVFLQEAKLPSSEQLKHSIMKP